MEFCLYCGAALTALAEKRRTQTPMIGRTCISCGQTDELNSTYCVFCRGKIVGADPSSESAAFKRFSWELEQVGTTERAALNDQVERASKPRGGSFKVPGAALLISLCLIGLVAGGGLAFALGPRKFQMVWLQYSLPKGSVVVYTRHKFSDVLIESPNTGSYMALRTDENGNLCETRLQPGHDYRLKISAPNRKTVVYSFPLQEKKTTILGFPEPIELPPR